ncbi:MAG TPA: phosphotransferase [Thermoanaerobaculia bacterium]|nr:phosphotransferase [Thermoanaerobaculia bacterium]
MLTEKKGDLPDEVAEFLGKSLPGAWSATALRGDASVRGYFRVTTSDGSYMMAYYPESIREGLRRFLDAYDAIRDHSRVPRVLQHSPFAILQHDLGDETLFDVLQLDRRRALPLYREAVDLLIDFQRSPAPAQGINPPFDETKFSAELRMTLEFYVQHIAPEKDTCKLDGIFSQLAENLTRHPYVLCHRDYHGQNLHIYNGILYMIDFQDLRMGPDTYDLASLIRDRGVWKLLGRTAEEELLAHYATATGSTGDIQERYYEALLQRSIKAIGTFARQAVVRNRRNYLDFIPSTLETVDECISHLPDFEELRSLFPLSFDAASFQ